jgi:hypothetical protein
VAAFHATCDPAEVVRLENALVSQASAFNLGVGIVDLRTGQIWLFTYDRTDAFSRANLHLQVMAGHEAAATMAGTPLDHARGFALAKTGAYWHVFNRSHLNRTDGQSNTMEMATATFQEVLAALSVAGIQNPILG